MLKPEDVLISYVICSGVISLIIMVYLIIDLAYRHFIV